MSFAGKQIRLSRIFRRDDGKTVIIAVDHGRRYGAIQGLERFADRIKELVRADIDALMMTPAMIEKVFEIVSGKVGLIARIDGTGGIHSRDETDDRLISSVKRAVAVGADAAAVMVYPGSDNENMLWEKLALVVEEAYEYGIPVLAEAVPRPPRLPDKFDPEAILYGARISAELGADIVKIPSTGSRESFRKIIESTPVPVVVLGGPKVDSLEKILRIVWESMKAGAKGVAIGRNVFQHDSPVKVANALSLIVHENYNHLEAMKKTGLLT
ncbi:MAG: fructose-bisphosphate aldolase [Thermoprotei archaeon]|nr:MAG: fructose-bisphosphate aldolase [Thermoprotei archaeon]